MMPNFEERQQKRTSLLRSIYDYTMGIIWMGLGAFFLFHERFGFDLGLDKVLTTIFGIAALFYGAFRIYRGVMASRTK